jgi:Holliday junction resolvase RusA-like endonuclease
MSQLINMTVPGEPKPWQVWVKMSAPTPGYIAFKVWQAMIQVACKQEWGNKPLIETAVEINLVFIKSYPNNLPKREANRERRLKEALCQKPDLDNMVKAAIDGVKGIILKDDTVVTRLSAEKRFGPEPMTMITVYKSESLEEAVPDPHSKEVRD